MPFNTYSPDLVYDAASRRGVAGVVAKVTDLLTGVPVNTYDENGAPRPVITNPQGYISTFWTDDTVSQIMVEAGGVSLPMIAQELVGAGVDAALAAQAAAEAAQQAAQDAAGLVGAPADSVVGTLVSTPGTDTKTTLDAAYAGKALATTSVEGLMPAGDKSKLDAATEAATAGALAKRDASGRIQVGAPAAAGDAVPKSYSENAGNLSSGTVPAARLPLATSGANGAMPAADKAKLDAATTAATASTIAMRTTGGRLIVGTPTGTTDATTKAYVDTSVSGTAAAVVAAEAREAAARDTTARVVHYEHGTYGSYEVITVATNGQFIPNLVRHEYADNYQAVGTTGTNFKPVRKNLDYEFERTGYDIITNASGWATTGNVDEITGVQIRNGIIYHDFGASGNQKGTDAIGFRADGTSKMYSIRWGDSAASMVADGVLNAFGFGPTLVNNGVQVNLEADTQWDWFKTEDSARQILGQSSTGDIIIISVFGVSAVSGIKGNEVAAIAALHGCHNAVMLDGGGSAQAVTNGIYAHTSSDSTKQRPAPDYLAIRTRVLNELDTKWVNCTLGASGTQQGATLPAAKRRGDEVSLRWGVSGTGLAANTFYEVAFLPAGIPGPSGDRYFPVVSNTPAGAAQLVIEPTGRIVLRTGASVGTYYMFDAIRFRIM